VREGSVVEHGADTIAPYRATRAADRPVPPPEILKSRLRARAHELGITEIGFTSADPLPRAQAYERWLAAGRHAGMEWLRPGERSDPAALLPGARTLLAAVVRYSRPEREPNPIAAYAQRDDYHHVMKRALRRLAAELRALVPGSGTRVAVDTAPLREREAAMRAGVGWIGKNTMLVHLQHGCYTLLGELLWTEEIEPDPPAVDHCGECRRCLDACPTGAFPKPYELDARRCLSFATIENRGPIPPELRDALSIRAFGCDACLAACPFGGRALFREAELLPTRADLAQAGLRELLERARDRFWRSFGPTPVERARRRGLLRNLLVAAGNSGDPELRPLVEPFLDDPDPTLAEHARHSAARLGRATGATR
jgi:epoxyqueuosine reductase